MRSTHTVSIATSNHSRRTVTMEVHQWVGPFIASHTYSVSAWTSHCRILLLSNIILFHSVYRYSHHSTASATLYFPLDPHSSDSIAFVLSLGRKESSIVTTTRPSSSHRLPVANSCPYQTQDHPRSHYTSTQQHLISFFKQSPVSLVGRRLITVCTSSQSPVFPLLLTQSLDLISHTHFHIFL